MCDGVLEVSDHFSWSTIDIYMSIYTHGRNIVHKQCSFTPEWFWNNNDVKAKNKTTFNISIVENIKHGQINNISN